MFLSRNQHDRARASTGGDCHDRAEATSGLACAGNVSAARPERLSAVRRGSRCFPIVARAPSGERRSGCIESSRSKRSCPRTGNDSAARSKRSSAVRRGHRFVPIARHSDEEESSTVRIIKKKNGAEPGIEPGTSCTQNRNHTSRGASAVRGSRDHSAACKPAR